jgi:hypothetical protein
MSVRNVFQTVAPRAAAGPSAAPRLQQPGRAPGLLRGSTPRTLDTLGRRGVSLAPKSNGSFHIESGAAAEAAVLKRQALRRGGI